MHAVLTNHTIDILHLNDKRTNYESQVNLENLLRIFGPVCSKLLKF